MFLVCLSPSAHFFQYVPVFLSTCLHLSVLRCLSILIVMLHLYRSFGRLVFAVLLALIFLVVWISSTAHPFCHSVLYPFTTISGLSLRFLLYSPISLVYVVHLPSSIPRASMSKSRGKKKVGTDKCVCGLGC